MASSSTRVSSRSRTAKRGSRKASKARRGAGGARPPAKLIETDRHTLYQKAVQSPDLEMAFVDRIFKKIRGKPAKRLREDFCGTAISSCEWVRRRKGNIAVGLDLHAPTLAWGVKHNLAKLTDEQRSRLTLLQRNVLTPGDAGGMDCILAMNFSYWCFKDRATLRRYFEQVHKSLAPGGLLFMDSYGGWECGMPQKERRRIAGDRKTAGFTYIWEQASFDPISSHLICQIHFKLKNKRKIDKAFTYDWRLWTLPEIRELLAEAGFKTSTVYWEGDDGNGGGNGIFRPATKGEACASWISYLVAAK